MDYHFVTPKVTQEKSNSGADLRKLFKLVKKFIPVIVLAALLPMMIALVVTPPEINPFASTKADTVPTLRIWFEPATSIARVSDSVDLDIYAQFDSDTKLVPELSVNLTSEGSITLSQNNFSYRKPFRGKVQLGIVNVQAISSGEAFVQVPSSQVKLTAYSGPIDVKTSPAKIIVQ